MFLHICAPFTVSIIPAILDGVPELGQQKLRRELEEALRAGNSSFLISHYGRRSPGLLCVVVLLRSRFFSRAWEAVLRRSFLHASCKHHQAGSLRRPGSLREFR